MLDSISESIDIWSQGQLHLYLREAEEKEPDLAVLQNLDRLLSGEGGSFGGNRVSRASLAVGLYLHALYMPLIDSQLFQSPSPPCVSSTSFLFPPNESRLELGNVSNSVLQLRQPRIRDSSPPGMFSVLIWALLSLSLSLLSLRTLFIERFVLKPNLGSNWQDDKKDNFTIHQECKNNKGRTKTIKIFRN